MTHPTRTDEEVAREVWNSLPTSSDFETSIPIIALAITTVRREARREGALDMQENLIELAKSFSFQTKRRHVTVHGDMGYFEETIDRGPFIAAIRGLEP